MERLTRLLQRTAARLHIHRRDPLVSARSTRPARLRRAEIQRILEAGQIGELSGRDLSRPVMRRIEEACLAALAQTQRSIDQASADRAEQAAGALGDLYRGGLVPAPETRLFLLDVFRRRWALVRKTGALEAREYAATPAAFRVLLSLPTLSEDELAEIYSLITREPARIAALITHPSAGIGLWRAAGYVRATEVEERLVEIPAALESDVIRSQLENARSLRVIRTLLQTGTEEGVARIARNLIRWRTYDLLTLLEEGNRQLCRVVEPADLERALTSANEETRLRAIQVLPRLRRATD